MIDSSDVLADLLSDTKLGGKKLARVSILDTDESALVIDISPAEIIDSWQLLRELLDETGRWPLVCCSWGGESQTLKDKLIEDEPFSRFFFEEAPGVIDASPRALIENSGAVQLDEFLKSLDDKNSTDFDSEWLEIELDSCMAAVGRIPKQDELNFSISNPAVRVDRWIFDQLIEMKKPPETSFGAFDWFEPDNAYMLLLPTTSGWEALAYCHFFGAEEGSEFYIAAGKRWEQKYGAELVCHYGTMLQCFVKSPPKDPADAWELAREHDLLAGSTLAPPGISIRDYARSLLRQDHWFLHDRP